MSFWTNQKLSYIQKIGCDLNASTYIKVTNITYAGIFMTGLESETNYFI
jgi:hypothetical protein